MPAFNRADAIGRAILEHHTQAPAILLGNHGVFAWGPGPGAALKAAAMVEDVAKTVMLAMQIGAPRLLSAEEAGKWHDRYCHGYGQVSEAA